MSSSNHVPRQAALALLPFLLSNPPFIPASFTSAALNQRHRILDISPEDIEDYLITNTYPTEFSTATRTVELLSLLVSQVEEEADVDQASIIGKIQYKCPEKNVVLVGVELGSKKELASPLLLLLLTVEGDQQEVESYKYDNLLPLHVVPGPWFDTMGEATSFEKSSMELSQTLSRAFPEDTPPIIAADDDPFDPSDRNRDLDDEAQGNGEYITNADEFWAGFESDEEDGRDQSGEKRLIVEENEEEMKARLQQEEKRYWQMYDQQESLSKQDLGQARNNVHNGESGTHTERYAKDRSETNSESVKTLLKKAWRLMQDASSSDQQSLESEFVSLASETAQEYRHEINNFPY